MSYQVRVAVAHGQEQSALVETLSLMPPGPREVLVQMKAAGICHSDLSFINGERSGVEYLLVLGHEGAGVVVECGSEVSTVKPGDHVIPV